MRKYCLIVLVAFFGCAFQNDKLRSVDQYIQSLHDEGRFDGAITIGSSDEKIYSKQIGIAVREWSIPIEEDTRFDICSLNKSF
ncbi:MAG: hypothetical protein AAFY41_19715, partial [Bacteroidota bacterium]